MAANWVDLVYKLSNLLQGSLTSVEILPGGLKEWESMELPLGAPKPCAEFPFVFVEGNLGIPKKVLYALYIAAISMPWGSSRPKESIAASTTIIILNPAHQTALNARKRLINDGHLAPERELIFTELISKGLLECAKQSIIWHHRQWCFRKIYGTMGPNIGFPQPLPSSEEIQLLPKISPSAIQHELCIIQHTCEIYPRNYHAWVHWQLIMNICFASIIFFEDSDSRREFLGIFTAEYSRLRHWIEHHVSDYSSMHQLCQIQKLVYHLGARGLLRNDLEKILIPSGSADHAFSLVVEFPSHEALWMYLRVALNNLPPEGRNEVLEKVQSAELPALHLKERLFHWFSRR